jgi:hypothetical protein
MIVSDILFLCNKMAVLPCELYCASIGFAGMRPCGGFDGTQTARVSMFCHVLKPSRVQTYINIQRNGKIPSRCPCSVHTIDRMLCFELVSVDIVISNLLFWLHMTYWSRDGGGRYLIVAWTMALSGPISPLVLV